MRIGGVEVSDACEDVLVLPRPTGEDIVFRARAVTDMGVFEKICPEPVPAVRIVPGGTEKSLDAPGYLKAVQQRSEKRFNYICILTLEPSEIEWSKVKKDQPETWHLWTTELQEAGLSSVEVNRVQNLIFSTNALDEYKLKAAREAFLVGQGKAQVKSSGQDTGPVSLPSGAPAKGSE